MLVGIESINAYCGVTCLDIKTLFQGRGLDVSRFDNLMMEKKSVGLPCEDPVTNAVNAANPIISQLDKSEKNNIELVITSSESAVDFAKSLSTYIHDYLELPNSCRLFEVKQACYGGTVALQMAVNTILASSNPDAKALVISTDTARAVPRFTYAEPSQGTGAVAMLVSRKPDIMAIDVGAYGLHSYEVMDVCRPRAELEVGNNDLSLLSYLDCLEQSYRDYEMKVEGADFESTFDYLAFHTPFGGMVKGAHRRLMQRIAKASPEVIEQDFQRRMLPSFKYCVQVGNIYSATTSLSLCGLIDSLQIDTSHRVGLFSYGSGCSSEFFSGVITPESVIKLADMQIQAHLDRRYELAMDEYDMLIDQSELLVFGVENQVVDFQPYQSIFNSKVQGRGILCLKKIEGYHRQYEWS